ncbi:MAG: hypothetical protein BroJett022_12590 [Actinomycetes bacterium]|nr:MAG: hypothetical protein BroJett022_12590 [Actinomycetes bacterium]
MIHSRALTVVGVPAALAANYWVLETVLAERADPAGSWISDLGARTESTGLLFDLLEVASGMLVVAFAALLVPALGRRSRVLCWGVVALAAVGACTVIDGAFPLSCAETLAEPCELRYDAVDLVHGGETFLSIAITIAMFALLVAGLRAEPDRELSRFGAWTGAAGVAWIACNALMGAQYLVADLAGSKGALQRAAQVVFGLWLLGLARAGAHARAPWSAD